MIEQPHKVPLARARDIRVCGASPRVVLRDEVPVVGPVFFELLEETVRLLLGEIELLQDRVAVEVAFEVYTQFLHLDLQDYSS
jgi:hypothetical protein